MRKISLLLFMVLGLASMALAQRTISGAVTDSKGAGLPSATVLEKGSTNGVVTDMDGKYALSVKDGATLVFSYVGYTDQEVTLGASNVVNVTLAEGTVISDVVVTALNISRDAKSLGYSTQKVDGSALTQNRETNFVNSLAGRVAGIEVNGGSGTMGGSARITIRGARSITGENQPLFVVDGVPMDNSNNNDASQQTAGGGYDYGNVIQDINPDDIESINVLKGGAAAALYGSRANNGVIMITTKKGGRAAKDRPIGVEFTSSVAVEQVSLLPSFQNTYGGGGDDGATINPFYTNTTAQNIPNYSCDCSWGPKLDGQQVRAWNSFDKWDTEHYNKTSAWSPNPNNVASFFNTGVSFNNSIALSGGNDVSNFRLSYTNLALTGIYPNSKLGRNILGFNGGLKLTDKLSTSVGINYTGQSALGRPGTGYDNDGLNVVQSFFQWNQRQLNFDELRAYKNPDGTQRSWNRVDDADGTPAYWDNPFWVRNESYQTDGRDRVFGNVSVRYEFAKAFAVEGRVMKDFYTDHREERTAYGSAAVTGGNYYEAVRRSDETNMDLIFKYNKSLASDLTLTAFAGGASRNRTFKGNFTETQGGLLVPNFYNFLNSVSPSRSTTSQSEKQNYGVFGSASLGYKNMLYLDLTARNDWSSTLPKGNNSYFYPSASLSYVFSEMGALKNSKILSFGKIRGAWAVVGNDAPTYSLNNTYIPLTAFDGQGNFTSPATLNNPNLRAEFTTSYEGGLQLKFLKNRVGIDASYYFSSSKDLIVPKEVTSVSGYERQYSNIGEMTNQGIELALTVTPIKTKDFSWDIAVNYAANQNKVVSLTDGTDLLTLGNAPFGVSVVAKVGQPYGTLMGTDFTRDANGNKVVDADGFYVPTAIQPLGNTMPKFTGGISNSFTYKTLTLSALIDARVGGSMYSISYMFGNYSGLYEETAANGIRENGVVAEGVTADGKTNTTNVAARDYYSQFYGLKAANVFDATFVKLREVRLSYAIPTSKFQNSPIRGINIALVGRNLAILHKTMPHYDPDYINSAGNVQGIEGGILPPTRTISLSLSAKF
jgi:TonB-linked SusC/RagA family outer membrane protein